MAKKKKGKKRAQAANSDLEDSPQEAQQAPRRSLRLRRRQADYAEPSDDEEPSDIDEPSGKEVKPTKSNNNKKKARNQEDDQDYEPPVTRSKKGKRPEVYEENEPSSGKGRKSKSTPRSEPENAEQSRRPPQTPVQRLRQTDDAETLSNKKKHSQKSVRRQEAETDYERPVTRSRKARQAEPVPSKVSKPIDVRSTESEQEFLDRMEEEGRRREARIPSRFKNSARHAPPPPEVDDGTDDEDDEDYQHSESSSSEEVTDDEESDDGDRMDLDTDKNDFGDAAGWGQPEPSSPSENNLRARESRERTPMVGQPQGWGSTSRQERRDHPARVTRSSGRVTGWQIILLRYDPDKKKGRHTPIEGRIRAVVTRGYLFVVLPSLNLDHMDLERGVLVKGREYPEAKQRFIDAGGEVIKSKPPSWLADSTWRDFVIICIAMTEDGSMTLIEGYVNKRHRRDKGFVSVSTLRTAYGGAESDALMLDSWVRVGQEGLKRKKPRLPADVMEFLAQRRLQM